MKKNRLPSSKYSGFRIPQDYLENLEDRVMERVTLVEEEKLPENHKNPFAVPSDYFIDLEDRVINRIIEQPKKESKVISLLNNEFFYYAAGVAAVFVTIVTSLLFQPAETFTIESLDMLSLENYIDETIDISNPEGSMLREEDLSFSPTYQENYIDQEALFEYLNENIEEPALIFNEE